MNDIEMQIRYALGIFFHHNQAKIETWLKTKNLNFGNMSPSDLIARGRGEAVLRFVKQSTQR